MLIGFAARARAELPQGERAAAPGATELPLLVRLAPTAEQRDQARTRMLEQRLVRLISVLPEVERAQVDIDRPETTDPLDQPPRAPRVAVVVAVRSEWSPRQTRASIQHIVSAVLPALAPSDLTVVERTPRPDRANAPASAHSLVQIGPFLVHRQSAAELRLGLAGLLATNALLAVILLWRTRLVRARTARRTES
jgi:type III secretory pathway lipoprotein EscJ